MRLLTGFGTPRCWADAKFGIIWMRYPINDQTDAAHGCPVVIDGTCRATVLGIEVVLINL